MEQKMEYMVLSLSTGIREIEESINHFARQGWIVICPLNNFRLLLGREVK
jgi:hypothetical protein